MSGFWIGLIVGFGLAVIAAFVAYFIAGLWLMIKGVGLK